MALSSCFALVFLAQCKQKLFQVRSSTQDGWGQGWEKQLA